MSEIEKEPINNQEVNIAEQEPDNVQVKVEADTLDEIDKKTRKLARAEKDVRDLQRLGIYAFLLIFLFWVLFSYVVGIATVRSDDMEPRIDLGDLVIYFRLEKDIRTQDVIVFEKDGKQYIGRIVAASGDKVEVTENDTLKVNDNAVYEQKIFYPTSAYESDVVYPLNLEADEFFVLGDRRNGAEDSRYFGPVKRSEIKGVIITVIRRNNL